MPDFVKVTYEGTGASQSTNELGMRAMQARVFDARNAQYLLVKAPPASGKSRALMFIGLDKLENQGLKKVIVAVPERAIGTSFRSTALSKNGFFKDWEVHERWNLTTPGGAAGKVNAFVKFMESNDQVLVCTHATLRFAFDRLRAEAFDECLLAVDEFHHASADTESRLGEVVRGLMEGKRAHLVAMTGSYFRGDATPVLRPEDEERFTRVSYTYYEQLNGYKDLKTLGIGYHFYRGSYGEAIGEILDPEKKTIVHIPAVQSAASSGDKYIEVDRILDQLGTIESTDPTTGFYLVRRPSGEMLKVADLVTENDRDRVVTALRNLSAKSDLDVIIALGMAKEGFDWIWCEHALTVGYRGSLTEIIQIIGRATRDAPGKAHAQFTNLISAPEADSDTVAGAVNNMLKAIACSLLMEQVLAPNFNFRTRPGDDDLTGAAPAPSIVQAGSARTVAIHGLVEPSTARTRQIIESDLTDLMAAIFQDETVLRASMNPEEFTPEVVNQVFIPQVIEKEYPELSEGELEEVRQHVVANAVFRSGALEVVGDGEQAQAGAENSNEIGANFIRMSQRFVNIDELHVDLIDTINPFQMAYEVLSKSVTAEVLKRIHETIVATKIAMTEEEAALLWPRIEAFKRDRGIEPNLSSPNPLEKRLAEALAFIRDYKRRKTNAREALAM